jgi:hypothetical protein
MSRRIRYLCGTPSEFCQGAHFQTDQLLKSKKAHASSEDAFKCYAHYLIHHAGYKRIGQREFSLGHDKPILVLTKKIRFGGALRQGKEGRFQPNTHNSNGLIY